MHPPRIRPRWPAVPKKAAVSPLLGASVARPFHTSQRRTIRSIVKPAPVPNRWNNIPGHKPQGASAAAAIQRRLDSNTLHVRTGALAIKKGMSAIYDATTGTRTPVTILQLDRLQVIAHKTKRKHGYDAVVLGYGWQPHQRVNRAQLGIFANAKYEDSTGGIVGVAPKRHVREFQVRGASDPEGRVKPLIGQEIKPNWWKVGDWVDVKGTTIGKGFAGVIKRWGMGGQPASHGVSLTHRSLGSAGGGQGSGSRVHPGKKMAGRMGGNGHTIQNLKVMSVDEENGIIAVSGSVPGPKKGLVKIVDAVKKPWPEMRDVELPPPKATKKAKLESEDAHNPASVAEAT